MASNTSTEPEPVKGLTETEAYDIKETLSRLSALNEAESIIITGTAELSTGREVHVSFDADECEFRALV